MEERRYRIEVAMEKGFERPIHLEVGRRGSSQVAVFLAWNREPTATDQDFHLEGFE